MRWKSIYLTCTLLAVGMNQPVLASACGEGSPTYNWVDSIESQDWARMQELLTPDATYDDPTVVHLGQNAIALVGREAIIEFFRDSSEELDARNIDYEITQCFESGGITVLTMTFSISTSGAYWNINTELIDLTGIGTTVITHRPEGIAAVVDYVDYAGIQNQIERFRLQYGEAKDSDSNPEDHQ